MGIEPASFQLCRVRKWFPRIPRIPNDMHIWIAPSAPNNYQATPSNRTNMRQIDNCRLLEKVKS